MKQPVAEKNETTAAVTLTTAAFTNAANPHNLIVVWLWYHSLVQTVSIVTDTGGNVYQRAVGPTAGAAGGTIAGFQQEIWYAKNINGGTNFTVTATFSPMPAVAFERSINAHEYSGACDRSARRDQRGG